ncbi:arginine--tRNA ligase [Candidatus Omnitrophota bacterium]
MTKNVRKVCESALGKAVRAAFPQISPEDSPPICLDIPKESAHGDVSSNIALQLARLAKESPVVIAEKIKKQLEAQELADLFSKIEIKPPGFINFFINPAVLYEVLSQVLSAKEEFARSDTGKGQKVQVEFVSANPTGPLSVAHARQAAVGDALANILSFLGYKVTREYYKNDEGVQIELLGKSIFARCQELLGEETEFPENGYHGEYIYDIAREIIETSKTGNVQEKAIDFFSQYGVEYILKVIEKDLLDFKVHYDCWFSQAHLSKSGKIKKILELLKKKGFTYEKDGAVWFASTRFGDDKDRVLVKKDGSNTYITADIAYHQDKFKRGLQKVIDIWGPDHHGYINRMKAAVEALGKPRDALSVIIVQLATIYKEGKPMSMSTRAGRYISLRQVIDEIGTDVARFFFLMRRVESHLDFDIDIAKKQSEENPVYYIQYAHARIASIKLRSGMKRLNIKKINFDVLNQPEELRLIKLMGQFEDVLSGCAVSLDPYALVNFLQEFASAFHSFYDKHKVIGNDEPLTNARLALVEAVRIVLAQGLQLLGVSVPEKM